MKNEDQLIMLLRRLFCIAAFFITTCTCLSQTVYYVATNGLDTRTGTGAWTNALGTISNAVNKANNSDAILVSGGTYNVTAEIVITKHLTLTGIDGRETTFMQGNYTSGRRGLLISNANALVSGFTITNFNSGNWGGGVRIYSGHISNCVITGCGGTRGGGIYGENGPYTIANCIISNCIGTSWGGGARLTGIGTMANCIIEANTVAISGGGLSLSSNGMVSGCVMRANMASAAGSFGMGAYVSQGVLTHCDIENNGCDTNTSMAGGLYLASSTSTAMWCRITGNVSKDYGGGVVIGGGGLMRNCLVAGNTCKDGGVQTGGGGISMVGSGTVESCTIVENSAAPGKSAGIYFRGATAHNRQFINTIIYNNIAGGIISNWSSDVATQFCFTNSCTTPSVAAYGLGNTTNDPALTSVYYLLPGSPCINAGLNQTWMTGTSDLDGRRRLDWGSGVVDMGCYEFVPSGMLFLAR